MLDIRKILYPTDFSEEAERALPYAVDLAARHGAELHVLHLVVLHAAEDPDLERVYRRLEEEARERLEEISGHEVAERLSVVPEVDRAISPAPAILDHAAELDVDLIVMGSHGRRGLRRLLVGSVAEEVVRLSPAPVLTVRGERAAAHDGRPEVRRIVAPVDFSSHAELALGNARQLALAFDAELVVLHVIEQATYPDFYLPVSSSGLDLAELRERAGEGLERLVERVEEEPGSRTEPRIAIRVGRTVREIVDFAREEEADVLVLASHGLHGLERALLGSVTEGVIRSAPCSVLTVKAFGKRLSTKASVTEAAGRGEG